MNYIALIFYSIILPLISSMQSKPKLCINCKHFIADNNSGEFGKCALFPTITNKVKFLVNGINDKQSRNYYYCSTSRSSNNMCGEEGKYYKKKRIPKKTC